MATTFPLSGIYAETPVDRWELAAWGPKRARELAHQLVSRAVYAGRQQLGFVLAGILPIHVSHDGATPERGADGLDGYSRLIQPTHLHDQRAKGADHGGEWNLAEIGKGMIAIAGIGSIHFTLALLALRGRVMKK